MIRKLLILVMVFFFSLGIFPQASFVDASESGSFTKTLKFGSIGDQVSLLQTVLSRIPDTRYRMPMVSGKFDRRTKNALKKFQKQYGLKTSGIVDHRTRKILNELANRLMSSDSPTSSFSPPSFSFSPPSFGLPTPVGFLPPSTFPVMPPPFDPQTPVEFRPPPPLPVMPLVSLPVQPPGSTIPVQSPSLAFPLATLPSSSPTSTSPELSPNQPSFPSSLPSSSSSTPSPLQISLALQGIEIPKPSNEIAYFSYSWKGTDTISGEEKLPTSAPKPIIVLDGKKTLTLESNAALKLAQLYQVYLLDDEEKWDDESAGLFMEMLRRLPSGFPNKARTLSLTNTILPQDIEILPSDHFRISKPAFARANPTLVPGALGTDGRIFYSNRLFQALLRIIATDRWYLNKVFQERYGVEPAIVEPKDEFQEFTMEELYFIAAIFEDFPEGFHRLMGLTKIARRKNGLVNPEYPICGALAHVGAGFIEFTDAAFKQSREGIQKLVAHEMGHFVFANILSQTARNDFLALSGWTRTKSEALHLASEIVASDHPKATRTSPFTSSDLWYRSTSTNFVSQYAASVNPDEDFAETISSYLYQPDWLRTIAPSKYTFIKDVVDGYEYVVLLDKQYTFEVFNLSPDDRFPGQIIGVDIEVFKLENGDNRVKVTLQLSEKGGKGAKYASAAVFSPASISAYATTQETFTFHQVNQNSFLLRAEKTIGKTSATGYWYPRNISLQSDSMGISREQHISQFGWKLLITNEEQDREPFLPDINLITSEMVTKDGDILIRIFIPVNDKDEDKIVAWGSIQQYQTSQSILKTAVYDKNLKSLIFEFEIRKYHTSGEWEFRGFQTEDAAKNRGVIDLKDKALRFTIANENPDLTAPEMDTSSLKIEAKPTHPEKPDGETMVTISVLSRDNNSGVRDFTATLINPMGRRYSFGKYADNSSLPYPKDDPMTWKDQKISIQLPVGSAPGIWGVTGLTVTDRAGNILRINFEETGILKPFKVY